MKALIVLGLLALGVAGAVAVHVHHLAVVPQDWLYINMMSPSPARAWNVTPGHTYTVVMRAVIVNDSGTYGLRHVLIRLYLDKRNAFGGYRHFLFLGKCRADRNGYCRVRFTLPVDLKPGTYYLQPDAWCGNIFRNVHGGFLPVRVRAVVAATPAPISATHTAPLPLLTHTRTHALPPRKGVEPRLPPHTLPAQTRTHTAVRVDPLRHVIDDISSIASKLHAFIAELLSSIHIP